MDWGYKAMLTATTVAALLMAAQLFGRRVAGVVAGLPVTTAPSLLWIAAEQGTSFAARSAIGSLAACGAAAVFALAYERVARSRGVVASMAAALGAGGVVALMLALLTAHANGLQVALLATTVLCALALRWLPAAAPVARPATRIHRQVLPTAVVAGIVSAAIAGFAPLLGAFWSGLLASLPVIASAVLVHEHRTATHPDRQRFLRGYAMGLVGKAAFATVFAASATLVGVVAATLLSFALGIAVSAGLATRARPAPRVADA